MEAMQDETRAPSPAAGAEDALLTAWARRGDRAALGELFALCRPQAYALALRICGRAAAEDAVQDGFLKAMRQARAWRGGSARGWLLATVANTARDAVRSDTRRVRREADAPRPTPMPDIPADRDLAEEVRAALGELPAHERTALELHFFAGLDLEQAAATLGRPYKTVHSQVARGLERLRDILGRRGVTVSLGVVSAALAGTADAAEPPGLAAAVERLAATGPAPAAAVPWPVLASGVAILLAGGLWLLLPGTIPSSVVPRPAQTTADPPPTAAVDPQSAILAQQVQVRFRHDSLDEALAALARALPAGSGFRYAIPTKVTAPWPGITWIPEGPCSVRQALDALTAQAGLAWTAQGGVVVVHAPVGPADEAELLAAIRDLAEPTYTDPAELAGMQLVTLRYMIGYGGATRNAIATLPAVARPGGLARLLAAGLDPLKPGLGQVVLGLGLTSPGWYCDTSWGSPENLAPQRVAPLTALTGDPVGDAAVRCLRAIAQRVDGQEGRRCQAVLAAQVAAATRAPGAAEAITAVLKHDPGPEEVGDDLVWRVSLAGCLAVLQDPHAVPDLVAALRGVRQDAEQEAQAYATRVLAAAGAVEVLCERRAFYALGWCPDGAGLTLVRQRIADPTVPRDSDQEASALLNAGARSVPPELALFLAPGEFDQERVVITTALGRCGGSAGVAPLLSWAERDGRSARAAGRALALVEDPQALPLLVHELASPQLGRVTAAAVGLASSRLPGATDALRAAIAAAGVDEARALALWNAAVGGRDDALAAAAIAEARRRGPQGVAILDGLGMARTPAALLGGWTLAGDPAVAHALRVAALRRLPRTDLPARAQALNAILADRTGAPEVRATAIIETGVAELPACQPAFLAAAVEDPSGWVRACVLFASHGEVPEGFYAGRLRADASPQARCYAAAQLGQTVEDAVALGQALLVEQHPRVRETIARMLAQNADVAQDEQRTATVRAAAAHCLATETDPAAKAALQALRDGGEPEPAQIGQHGDEPWSYRIQHGNFVTGKSWERCFWPPRQLAEGEDPGLPFGDG